MTDSMKLHNSEDLEFIQQLPVAGLVDLCKLSFDTLKSGQNISKQEAFSAKYGSPVDRVQVGADIILLLLVDFVKKKAKNLEGLQELGFSEEQEQVLTQFISSKLEIVDKIVSRSQEDGDLHFRSLDWRLEARVASRAMNSHATPIITMKLHLDSETCPDKKAKLGSTEQQVTLQTDPNTLVHLIGTLENALWESKTHRTRNFVKSLIRE